MAAGLCLLLLPLWAVRTVSDMQPVYRAGSPVAAAAAATLDFGSVPAGTYDTNTNYEPGGIGILFHLVEGFLSMVQPNPFPQELARKIAQQRFAEIQGEYQKTLHYEVGFLVAAAIGLLFILLMPLVGLCFCMCRCCDNCGGEMHQRQKKNNDCKRGCFATFLFASSLIMSICVLSAYAANQHLTTQVRGTKKLVNSNFKDLKTLINEAPMQIDYLVNQYNTTKNKAMSDLNNIGPLLGGRVQEQLGREVRPAFDAILNMAGVKVERAIKAIRETKEALENVSVSVEVMKEGTERLQANLTDAKANLSNTLGDPACKQAQAVEICNSIRNSFNQLNINANFSGLPNVTSQLNILNDIRKTDLTSLVQKGYAAFNDTPELVQNQTRNIESDIKNVLDSIGGNISNFSKVSPVQHILSNASHFVTQSEAYIREYYPVVEQYDFYRWLGSLVLCCMLILILIFFGLGLLCGSCGYDRHASPTTRGCISNTGGNLLMAGVGFSFLFSWVLMAIVLATFIAGGNVEKLVCEPYADRSIFKVLDTPYLLNSQWRHYLSGVLFQSPNVNLTFEKVYSDCKENKGIYSALEIENVFHLNELLNISMYMDDIESKFEHLNVSFDHIILLDETGKQALRKFGSAGIEDIDFDAFMSETSKSVTKVDLLAFANELEASSDKLPKGALGNALKGHANSIRMIHLQQVVPLEQSMKYVKARTTLNQSVRVLQRSSVELGGKIAGVISSIDSAQFLISHNASSVIIKESKRFADTVMGYFVQYLHWVKDSLSFEVATCKPLSNLVDTAVDVFLCSYVVDSVNAFWFGLGGATIFLIPAIVFAVKLAKFYRRMDTEDVYDDVEIIPMKNMENGNNSYHNEHLYGIPNPVMTSGIEQW
ncbi:prominin-1 isoform X4 [Ambystoma mexicanum]|uniref:prominin-1 isoform X4 n=1 Tax=Ambystoma mexicanum TaxID=8296 RepID=UPI0037E75CDC